MPLNTRLASADRTWPKLYQCVRLALPGVTVPETHHLPQSVLRDRYQKLVFRLGSPFVLKALTGSGGRFNYLVGGEEQFLSLVDDPDHARLAFLAQCFVPNNGTFRLLVFSDDVSVVMHRCNTDGGHLTNTSRGGHATLFEPKTLDEDVKAMSARAASLMGYAVAGVNVVQHRDDRTWHVLEVTASPALGSGAFVDEKLDSSTRRICAGRWVPPPPRSGQDDTVADVFPAQPSSMPAGQPARQPCGRSVRQAVVIVRHLPR